MNRVDLTPEQVAVVEAPLTARLFLRGPAGTGKSSAAAERLNFLLASGAAGESILLFTPQRLLQDLYFEGMRSPERGPGGEIRSATIGGLARRTIELHWPLAAEKAGFAEAGQPPIFLNYENAQYYMAYLVRPLLDQGYFESVTIDRNRLYTQILNTLSRSAAVGFPYTEIGARLDSAWAGEPGRRRVYADVQDCATRFRTYCLEHNLLDFSLQLQVFWDQLWPEPAVRDQLRLYRHLIYDNVEEDIPRAHDLMRAWLPEFESALLVHDEGGGFRSFLGADEQTGLALHELCSEQVRFDRSFVISTGIAELAASLTAAIAPDLALPIAAPGNRANPLAAQETVRFVFARFLPEMIEAVVAEIQKLVTESRIPPSEIVLLAPFLPDSLRFAITSRLEARGLPWRTHRPSRSLHDEPASKALLTLAALAHPYWGIRPSKPDVAHALMLALDVDLVRAQLLAGIVYRIRDFTLTPFDQIVPEVQERLTLELGSRYAALRDWLLAYREGSPLPFDHFLRRFFGEVLSQPGFGFQRNLDAARLAGSLTDSVHNFRLAMEPSFVGLDHPNFDFGREYVSMLQEGVLPAQYLESWRAEADGAILVAPAYTFLIMNRPATIQFWLDAGSSAWYERLDLPLTHPEVLSREWPPGRQWTFDDEERASREATARLAGGLLHRCRAGLYLGINNWSESGFEQRGALLEAFQKILQEQQNR
jgi:hypothetical protein